MNTIGRNHGKAWPLGVANRNNHCWLSMQTRAENPERARNIISHSQAAFSKLADLYQYGCCFFVFFMQQMLCDCDSELQLQTNNLDVNMKYMYSCTNKGSQTKCGIVYFHCYEFEFKIIETQYSKLEPQNLILDSQKHRVSRIEFQVETVNLHFNSTVENWDDNEMLM